MALDLLELRNAFGRFATGVCVITSAPEGFSPMGMTINSFSSVSLDPPLLLWSLQHGSDCAPAFRATKKFAVNVLSSSQRDISKQYARKNQHTLISEHFQWSSAGIPILLDAMVTFECEIWQRYDGGDHTIIVGRVTSLAPGDEASPLVFFDGAYRELA